MARSADLPGLRLPVVVSAQGPCAEQSGHGQEQRAGERFVAAVEKPHFVEDAQTLAGRQAVRPKADDHASFQHGAIGMRGMAEPGMGPGTERDGHPVAIGRGLGTKLPEVVRFEVVAVGDQPVRIAELAATDVVGRPRSDRLPIVVPGTDLLQKTPQRAVSVFEQL